MTARVLVIYTGGTIGMQPANGPGTPLRPVPKFLTREIRTLAELDPQRSSQAPHIDVLEYDALIDSSDMRPHIWVQIARDIEKHYVDYDGFVVVHGTDTMAYTASALSFFVESTAKPIVVTGSQLPFGVPRSDARNNLATAAFVAASMPAEMAQVCIAFGSKVLRGNRATKVSATAFDAFDSPRYRPLADVGIEIRYHTDLALPAGDTFRISDRVPPNDAVAVLRLFPGFSGSILRALCRNTSLRGLILEGYGGGNGPTADNDFLAAVRQVRAQGVVVAVTAQPPQARVRFGDYASGQGLAEAGAIGLDDMTVEAALTKLYYLISVFSDPADVEAQLRRPLAGEMGP